MKRNLFGVGAVVALTIALFQGPRVDSAEQVSARSVKGAACSYSGYQSTPCNLGVPSHCTGGNFFSAVHIGGNNGSHQPAGGLISSGNCTGDAQCPATLNTTKLTKNGCGGGG
ncbi:hypothetical protein [Gimesia fumaroli]|jgi:hypothetical protein|uniref:Uncharacterized protein n=1 Tax=Gimesia fumaroli TaxID=2527976 RepID=A0A518IES4_9PLAN|nr:hypothetical protein [Gimesia fumaroli]QDV51570.1 hypothetical protein Enr17x_36260 [Gimesia fumaroli]